MIHPSVARLADGRTAFRSSLTRLWTSPSTPVHVESVPREAWEWGGYVLARVSSAVRGRELELASGRVVPLAKGDFLLGALGDRFATLEATGSWQEVTNNGVLHLLGGGGLLGKVTSWSPLVPPMIELQYEGHVMVGGKQCSMQQFATHGPGPEVFPKPVVLLTGTSMSAGKTTAAQVIIRRLRRMGVKVVGAKLTGAGRLRDILAMLDAGAEAAFDFVDAGLPSTCCSPETFRRAAMQVLGLMAGTHADVAVVEVGASPLEPYNGDSAVDLVRKATIFHVLCASDPYAVVGALQAYGMQPDIVTGPTSNTLAGVQLVSRLTGLVALDFLAPSHLPLLDEALNVALTRDRRSAS